MSAQANQDRPPVFGAFEVVRPLAQGGMSVVHLARHRSSGEHVALKTVRVPDEVHLASLRREIHALGRLRHPGVVRIVAEGMGDRVPWYAMELLAGETLADVHARIWSREGASAASSSERTTVALERPAPVAEPAEPSAPSAPKPAAAGQLRRVLTLARRLCTALAFLHGEGIVHCDLKPQNVFVRPGDLPVIMDFGLAWRAAGVVGREVADVVTKIAGTPTYMAPEQIRLTAIDPRTDLYALGCLLYELVTGQPPFTGGHDVLVRHLTREPARPSSLVEAVPPELDALILGLLRKRPRDRIGHAEDVAAALERLGAEPEPFESLAKPRAYVYRPELSGRDEALREILAWIERPRRGGGALVLLGGESGIGKTYLATEIARRAGAELQVVASSCAPRGALRRGGGELQPLQELFSAIADRCTAMGAETTDRLLGPRAKVLAPFSGRFLRLPGVDAYPDPPELSGPAARERIFVALREALAAFAREQPLFLLLDDLQWADELTLGFLAALPRGFLDRQPLAILGTYRSDEAVDALAPIVARDDVHAVTIGRLDEANVRAVVRDMLAIDAPPDPFVRFLARQSEGNPFFVAEYLRTAVSEGLLRRTSLDRGPDSGALGSGVFEQLRLPRTIRDLVGRRLQGLSAPARALVDVASAVGRDFDLDLLQLAASPTSDVEAMEGIAELIARQVVEPVAEGRFQFVHDKVREVAYDQIPPERRRALHRSIASAIEARLDRVAEPASFAAILAHHWSLAAVDDKALDWLERAARRALARAAYREAGELFRRALGVAERQRWTSSLRRARLDAGVAQAAFGSGDLDVTEHHTRRALDRLGQPLPRTGVGWGVLLAREVATQIGHLSGLRRRRVAALAEREALREAARGASLMSHRYFYVDDALAMIGSSLRAVNLAERANVEAQVPRAYTQIGFAAGFLRQHRLAARYFARARGGAEAARDPAEMAFVLVVESVYHCGYARWGEAERAIDGAQAAVAQVDDPVLRELVSVALGHVEFYTGRVLEAQRRFEALHESALARQSDQHATWGLFSAARSLLARGRHDDALPMLEEARAALAKRPELQSEIICHGLLADALARAGRDEAARTMAHGTLARVERARPTGFAALEGYVGALEAYLTLLDRGHDVRAEVRRGVSLLAKFARVFPMSRPAHHRYRGELLLREGRRAEALRAFRRGLVEARRCGLPREEAACALRLRG